METFNDYNIDIDSFEFCTRKKCSLRKKCLRKVQTPNSSDYWTTGGNYDRATITCSKFIDKEIITKQLTAI